MLISVTVMRAGLKLGKAEPSEAELSIEKDEKGHVRVIMTRGGTTGFESMVIPAGHRLPTHDWCACLGREGEYDQIVVPGEEMERAFRAAGLLE